MTSEGIDRMLEKRVGSLETQASSMQAGISNLASALNDVKDLMKQEADARRDGFSDISRLLDQRTKPQTNVIIQIIGIGITMSVIAGTIAASRLTGIESAHLRRESKIDHQLELMQVSFSKHTEDAHAKLNSYRIGAMEELARGKGDGK